MINDAVIAVATDALLEGREDVAIEIVGRCSELAFVPALQWQRSVALAADLWWGSWAAGIWDANAAARRASEGAQCDAHVRSLDASEDHQWCNDCATRQRRESAEYYAAHPPEPLPPPTSWEAAVAAFEACLDADGYDWTWWAKRLPSPARPDPCHVTASGRTSWEVAPDGTVMIEIHRPARPDRWQPERGDVVVLRATVLPGGQSWVDRLGTDEVQAEGRHEDALDDALARLGIDRHADAQPEPLRSTLAAHLEARSPRATLTVSGATQRIRRTT